MLQTVLTEKICNVITPLLIEDTSIIVLKGIPLFVAEKALKIENTADISLEQVVANKVEYLYSSVARKRKIYSYEEFMLLKEFIISQYKTIYIVVNNIYIEQYPIDECFQNNVRQGLLNHFTDFDDSSSEQNGKNMEIGDIDEYISIYSGLREHNGFLLGAYCDSETLTNTKVVIKKLFANIEENSFDFVEESENAFTIHDEAEYIDFVKAVFSGNKKLYVNISNYTGNRSLLESHLHLLNHYWKDYTDIYFVRAKSAQVVFRPRKEFQEILKKYWNHDSFRSHSYYDVAKLENGDKDTINISQEQIVSDLVTQVETCMNGRNDFRDLFVTAPTGAGKSAMFQLPAIYLAENHNLLTIVISPLIGLMNDQVKNLEIKNYKYARTINSDISPVIKQDIIEKVASSQYHILYISPETLLSRSDVEQLIGDRTIGMIVIDEAHIVTTWGKQFRPDYWYLGDHITKLRKIQLDKKGHSFVIATFTATAIFHGIEDMYTETINSLNMFDPITYLGFVKRNDIEIQIEKKIKTKGERSEYELDKFEQIVKLIKRAMVTGKKTLVYFPTVALINRCYEFLKHQKMLETVAIYHGSLEKEVKEESYEEFLHKEKLVMLATKAFGMGIDIDDIQIVYHFAPTGNVCDYVQEIGRAARRKDLIGEALYHYDSIDFKHINRLHGLSTIKTYQIVEVIRKIDELYHQSLNRGGRMDFTKKRNSMLLDAQNFTYIFDSPISNESENINRVKTALLTIQKDFLNKVGFSPIIVRPIPLFAMGYFSISPSVQNQLLKKYPDSLEEIERIKHICLVNLNQIWKKDYKNLSFPKFKFLLYSNSSDLPFNQNYKVSPALCVTLNVKDEFKSRFINTWGVLKAFIHQHLTTGKHIGQDEISSELQKKCRGISKYKAPAICDVVIASIESYNKNFSRFIQNMYSIKTTKDGSIKYLFNVSVHSYFRWVETLFNNIVNEMKNGKLYLVDKPGINLKEYAVVLGILESLDVMSFEMIGGANSQIYIYVNQIQALRNILNAPANYKNRLLETVGERHLISVKMLTYIYENNFTNEETWNLIEDYFLGKIPDKVKNDCLKDNPNFVLSTK